MAGKVHPEVPTYEEFEPLCQWQRNEDTDILEIHLQGFKKDQLRVQISSHGILKISGERPVDTSSTSRFHKEVPAPSNTYNTQLIRAKFVNGHLYITMPKIKSQSNGPKVPPLQSEPSKLDQTPKPEHAGTEQPTVAALPQTSGDADGGAKNESTPAAVRNPPETYKFEKGKRMGMTKVAVSLAAAAAALAVLVAYVLYVYRSTVGEPAD